jgi:hypothetical protein
MLETSGLDNTNRHRELTRNVFLLSYFKRAATFKSCREEKLASQLFFFNEPVTMHFLSELNEAVIIPLS